MPPFALWACSRRQFAYILTQTQDRPASSNHSSRHDHFTISRPPAKTLLRCAHTSDFLALFCLLSCPPNTNFELRHKRPSSFVGSQSAGHQSGQFFLLSSQPPLPVPPSPTRPPIPCTKCIKNPPHNNTPSSPTCQEHPSDVHLETSHSNGGHLSRSWGELLRGGPCLLTITGSQHMGGHALGIAEPGHYGGPRAHQHHIEAQQMFTLQRQGMICMQQVVGSLDPL